MSSSSNTFVFTEEKYNEIVKSIIELKMQHNVLVRTTQQKSNISSTIPGYNLLDAAWKKIYVSNLVKKPELYKVELFDIPGNGGGQTYSKIFSSKQVFSKIQKTSQNPSPLMIFFPNKYHSNIKCSRISRFFPTLEITSPF
jgi:hypothetical protein